MGHLGNLEVPVEKEPILRDASTKLRRTSSDLVAHLQDPDPTVREYLLRALGTWMPAVPDGLTPVALRSIHDPSATIGRLGLDLIGRIDAPTPRVLSEVIDSLDSRPELRVTAAGVLGKLFDAHLVSGGKRREAPESVVSSLIRATADRDEAVRLTAVASLSRIDRGSEEIRSRLETIRQDPGESSRVRAAATEGLSHLAEKESGGGQRR